jgi:uncharacterized membrane protein YhaH (DUF805 family)
MALAGQGVVVRARLSGPGESRTMPAMALLWSLIGFVVLIIVVLTIVDIVRRHLGAAGTTAWILIVILVPIIGSIIYWVMRKPSADEVEQSYAAEAERRAQANRGR